MMLDELNTASPRRAADACAALPELVRRLTRRQRRELVELLVAVPDAAPDLGAGEELAPHVPTTPGHDFDVCPIPMGEGGVW